jgi:hypothetical protein
MGRLRCALATLVAGVLLVACSDDDPEPKVSDPTPSAASTSGTGIASPTGSPTPSLNAEDTVRAWIDARNAALQNGDTSSVDALSSRDCRSCEELNKVIREIYGAGGSFDTPGWTVNVAKEKRRSDPVQVDTALTFAAGETTPSAGAEPVSYEESKHIVTFKLTQVSGVFKVQLVLFLS